MGKVTPLRDGFENMQAFLAHIAEDDGLSGFVGAVMRKDGTMVPVHFKATREQMAFAAALLLQQCQEGE